MAREEPASRTTRPEHGATAEWWTVDGPGYWGAAMINHYRATYHEFTRWEDHPWARTMGSNGADFVQHWAIERFDRSVQGWLGTGRTGGPTDPTLESAAPGDPRFFSSYEEAAEEALRRLYRDRSRLQDEVRQVEQGIAHFEAALGGKETA